MRLLVVVDTYVPARISGALQMHDFNRELLAQGHTPTVLVPDAELDAPHRLERVDGVEVLRVRAPRTKDVGMVRRAIAEGLLSWVLWRGLRRSPLRDVRWEGVVWYSPTIFLGPIARHVMRRNRCRGYLILRDLFPDWAVDAGIMRRGVAWRLFKAVERFQYRTASVVGVQTPANAPLVAHDAPGARIEVLNNWLSPPAHGRTGLDLALTPLAGRVVFAYTGNMGAAQGMDCLLDLAEAMRDEPAGFLFVGRGSEQPRLRQRAQAAGLQHVLFVDELPSEEIPAILAQCHVGLIALDPRHTTHNIPGKFLTYLHAGLPVLARINPGNDLEALIAREDVGAVTTDTAPEALVAGARRLLGDPAGRARQGANARALVARDYSSAAVVQQVVRGLDRAR
jgi:glycosyltransferase involved in cell wall biosynthesis